MKVMVQERDGPHHGDWPYVIIHGTAADAFIALGTALKAGRPVRSVEQSWFVYPESPSVPIGPQWRITFWGKDTPFQMSLFTFFIHSDAIIAESVSAVAGLALILWYVAARRARAIVVMNAIGRRLFYFIDGIEFGCCWHGSSPSPRIIALAPYYG